MTAEILMLRPQQGKACCRPSLRLSPRSAAGLWHTIRHIVELIGWITVIGLIVGHIL